jgi:catechol 2,3-dioxygenase-like lactoylglutathione lyase family enzyme
MSDFQHPSARLVPELDVTDLEISMRFYVDVIGFERVFDRPRERFAYLTLDGAEIMLQEAAGPGRRFRTAPLERPFGRGVNLQIGVSDVDTVFASILQAGHPVVVGMEERWYDVEVLTPSGRFRESGPTQIGNRQFVVADPDGYLLRFFAGLGVRRR